MKIGIVKEIKDKENRVAATPDGVRKLVAAGHEVLVEQDAGLGSGFDNQEYRQAGARLTGTSEAWDVGLVVKVKEPLEAEYQYLDGQIVFTFFHLAGVTPTLTEVLLEKKVTAIAYELVEDEQGRLPVLAPMSAIAGNMAALMGSYYLAKFNQGKGMQLGQVLGRKYGKVLVIGDGVVGQHAAHVANAMGAEVFVAGLNAERLALLEKGSLAGVKTLLSNKESIEAHLADVDLLVGAVLCRGGAAPKIVTEDMVKKMQSGSVIVDVSIDQGGCVETSRVTAHSDPVFRVHDVVHYCVANMPGAYPKTATLALTDATLGYVLEIAGGGMGAVFENKGLLSAVNTYQGRLTCRQVALDLDMLGQYRAAVELRYFARGQ